jgi:hypothetical protein
MGLAVSTVLRGTYDFDKVNLVTFAMFIFSGTFVPVTSYPRPLAWLCEATPLWQAVALLRDLTARTVGVGPALHALYLAAIAAVAWKIASHRMEVLLHSLAVSSPLASLDHYRYRYGCPPRGTDGRARSLAKAACTPTSSGGAGPPVPRSRGNPDCPGAAAGDGPGQPGQGLTVLSNISLKGDPEATCLLALAGLCGPVMLRARPTGLA